MGGDGRFLPGTALFEGENVFKANDHVVEVLKTHGALLLEQRFTHSYPHCWRHKTPIIFRATPQWFIGMDKHGLREAALREIGQVAWMPDWGQGRIEGMVQGRPDWCISRQRTWGVPIALLVHKVTGALHPRTPELIEEVARRIELKGIEAWFELHPSGLLGETEGAEYDKINDTLDVWFDSGVTHACVLEHREGLRSPADLYLEGSDQHRGWFQSSLLTSVAMDDRAPYRQVLTHGFTVDAKGEKMSKSKGNVVSPQDVMKTLGADIIRLWVAATDYRGEMSVSDEILKRTADAYRRIRNTTRFLLANLNGFDPAVNLVAPEAMMELDRWAVDRALRLQEEIVEAYRSYQFHLIYQKVHNFCVVDLGGFYLDVIKDRQYTTQEDGLPRRSCQTALYHIAEAMVRWLAPVLSFTADEVWGFIPGTRGPTVFTETWYDGLFPLPDDDRFDRAYWDRVLAARVAVGPALETARKAADRLLPGRELDLYCDDAKAGLIGSSLDADLDIYCDDGLLKTLQRLGDELRISC